LSSSDIYVNVVGGLRASEPAADLAIILSIASAFTDTPVPQHLVTFGEVGLSGEVRSVSQSARRVAEAKRLGYSQAVGPAHGKLAGMQGVQNITEAIRFLGSTAKSR
jgi:DNA repair protein RadA/Sms